MTRARRGHTHVCPVCFATGPPPPHPEYPLCSHCYSEGIEVDVEAIEDFLDGVTLDELHRQRARFAKAKGFYAAYKKTKLAAMDAMIRQNELRR